MPSGAGLNRAGLLGGIPILTVATTATPIAVAAALASYGTIGVNDSGGVLHSAAGFTKWDFQLIGVGSNAAGYSVTLLGTTDPALLNFVYTKGPTSGVSMDLCAVTAAPASSWFVLPAPSEQSGTGAVTNPLVSGSGGGVLQVNMLLYAVRAIVTANAATISPITVIASAVP